MKRSIAAWLVMAAACAADPAVRITAGTRGKNHVVEVRGSGFPDGNLEVALIYVRKYPIPPGLREEGGPEFDEELIDVDMARVDVESGAFEAFMDYADSPAWSGDYRVLVTIEGEKKALDGAIGASSDIAAQRARADQDLYSELARFERLRHEFLSRWNALGADADAGWAAWRKDAERRTGLIRDRNGRRRKAGIYLPEYQGRDKVQKLLQRFSTLLTEAGPVMSAPKTSRPDPAGPQETLLDFEAEFEAYLDYFGFDRIVDNAGVAAAIGRMRDLRDEIGAFRARLPAAAAAWKEGEADLRFRALEAQMSLQKLLPEPLFGRFDALQKSLQRAVDHGKALAAGAAPAKTWDACVTDFDEAARALQKALPVPDDTE